MSAKQGNWEQVIFSVVNLVAGAMVIVFFTEHVFVRPETLFVALSFTWGAFSLVYHTCVICKDNMRVFGLISFILGFIVAVWKSQLAHQGDRIILDFPLGVWFFLTLISIFVYYPQAGSVNKNS